MFRKPGASFSPSSCIHGLAPSSGSRDASTTNSQSCFLLVTVPTLSGPAQPPLAPPIPQPWLPYVSDQTHEAPLRFRSHASPLAHFLLILFNAATSPQSGPRGLLKTKIRMFSIWPNCSLGSLIPTQLLPHKENFLKFFLEPSPPLSPERGSSSTLEGRWPFQIQIVHSRPPCAFSTHPCGVQRRHV